MATLARWSAILLLSISLTAPVCLADPDTKTEIAAPAPTPTRYLYLMSQPVPMDVQIGRLGQAFHYAYWATEILVKTGAFYAASGHTASTAAFFMFTLGHSAPYLTAHTAIDIKVRQAIKSSWLVRKLRDVPGIERAIILSGGELGFTGPMVTARKSQNYVFVETSEPLSEMEAGWYKTFGYPINVTDSATTRMKFKLIIAGEPSPLEWEAPLLDVLDRKAIPFEIAEMWRMHIRTYDDQIKHPGGQKRPSLDYLLGKHNRQIQVDATLSLPGGQEVPIKSLISGGQVRKLLGMSFFQRARDFFVEKVLGGQLVERPVSFDTKNFTLKKCETLLKEPFSPK